MRHGRSRDSRQAGGQAGKERVGGMIRQPDASCRILGRTSSAHFDEEKSNSSAVHWLLLLLLLSGGAGGRRLARLEEQILGPRLKGRKGRKGGRKRAEL